MFRRKSKFLLAMALVTLSGCRGHLIEDSSAFALDAGQATMVLGGCARPLSLGYESCQVKKGANLPKLTMAFMNAAEYAVSDCSLGIYKTGSVAGPQLVELDLSGLDAEIQRLGFCLLRVEAVERYPSKDDPKQFREIPFAGGFFVEVLDDGYFPKPSDAVVSWCYKISGTNKGRRKIDPCP